MKIEQFESMRKDDLEASRPWRQFAPPVNKTPTNPDYPQRPFNHDEWMKSSKPMEESTEVAEVGDLICTKGDHSSGKVEQTDGASIQFRTRDGKLMKTNMDNVVVVQKADPGQVNSSGMKSGFNSVFEGTMGGINRCAPAQDVSYERVLDESNDDVIFMQCEMALSNGWPDIDPSDALAPVMRKFGIDWDDIERIYAKNGIDNIYHHYQDFGIHEEVKQKWLQEQGLTELSVQKLQAYKQAAASPKAVRTRSLSQLAKSVAGTKTADRKIRSKTGHNDMPRPDRGTYEERLQEFLNMDEAFDKNSFTDILNKQHADDQEVKKKMPSKDIPFHGWTIRYRPAANPGDKVSWIVMDKKNEIKHKGESMSDKEAVGDAQEWIKAGGGTKQQASNKVTIDFNIDFAKEFAPGGETFYVMFDKSGNVPMMYLSLEPQEGFKKSHVRTQKSKVGGETTLLQMVPLSAAESNKIGLQPNGRYMLGDKEPIDDHTAAFPLIYQSTVQSKGDMVKMGKPGITVAHNRDMDEEYEGPWKGDPAKLKKAPKSSMQGQDPITFAELVKDSIKEHGLKWAFDFYVKKHGLPPRHFKIFAGI